MVDIAMEVHAVIAVSLKGFNIIILRRPKSISPDSLALCKFNRGKKKVKTEVGTWEDQTTQSRADRDIELFADFFETRLSRFSMAHAFDQSANVKLIL